MNNKIFEPSILWDQNMRKYPSKLAPVHKNIIPATSKIVESERAPNFQPQQAPQVKVEN
jgi:hypothetical protein